jgi:hypothetical protein
MGANFGQGLESNLGDGPLSNSYLSCYGYVNDSPSEFDVAGWETAKFELENRTHTMPNGTIARPFMTQAELPQLDDFMWMHKDMNKQCVTTRERQKRARAAQRPTPTTDACANSSCFCARSRKEELELPNGRRQQPTRAPTAPSFVLARAKKS